MDKELEEGKKRHLAEIEHILSNPQENSGTGEQVPGHLAVQRNAAFTNFDITQQQQDVVGIPAQFNSQGPAQMAHNETIAATSLGYQSTQPQSVKRYEESMKQAAVFDAHNNDHPGLGSVPNAASGRSLMRKTLTEWNENNLRQLKDTAFHDPTGPSQPTSDRGSASMSAKPFARPRNQSRTPNKLVTPTLSTAGLQAGSQRHQGPSFNPSNSLATQTESRAQVQPPNTVNTDALSSENRRQYRVVFRHFAYFLLQHVKKEISDHATMTRVAGELGEYINLIRGFQEMIPVRDALRQLEVRLKSIHPPFEQVPFFQLFRQHWYKARLKSVGSTHEHPTTHEAQGDNNESRMNSASLHVPSASKHSVKVAENINPFAWGAQSQFLPSTNRVEMETEENALRPHKSADVGVMKSETGAGVRFASVDETKPQILPQSNAHLGKAPRHLQAVYSAPDGSDSGIPLKLSSNPSTSKKPSKQTKKGPNDSELPKSILKRPPQRLEFILPRPPEQVPKMDENSTHKSTKVISNPSSDKKNNINDDLAIISRDVLKAEENLAQAAGTPDASSKISDNEAVANKEILLKKMEAMCSRFGISMAGDPSSELALMQLAIKYRLLDLFERLIEKRDARCERVLTDWKTEPAPGPSDFTSLQELRASEERQAREKEREIKRRLAKLSNEGQGEPGGATGQTGGDKSSKRPRTEFSAKLEAEQQTRALADIVSRRSKGRNLQSNLPPLVPIERAIFSHPSAQQPEAAHFPGEQPLDLPLSANKNPELCLRDAVAVFLDDQRTRRSGLVYTWMNRVPRS